MADPDWLQTGSYDRGFAQVDDLYARQAQRTAGRAVARGDYQAGAGALLNRGDLQGGLALQGIGQEQEAARKAKEAADLEGQLDFTLRATGVLENVLAQGGDVLAEFDKLSPVFAQFGTPPEQVAQFRGMLEANPQGFLGSVRQIAGQQQQELIFQKRGADVLVFEPGNPDPVRTFEAPAGFQASNGVVYNDRTGDVRLDTRTPNYQRVEKDDGTVEFIAIDPPAPVGAGQGAPSGGRTSFDAIIGPLLQREGGFVASDGSSGAPANFGINQRANPDIDVRNLTREQAAEIYRDRYWTPVVQAGVPEFAREAVFDFAVNAGPTRALQLWEQSGGDLGAFNEARRSFYRGLPDYQRYGPAWERRVDETSGGATANPAGGVRVVGSVQGANTGPQWQNLTPDEVVAGGYAPGSVVQRNTRTGQVNIVRDAATGAGARPTEAQNKDSYNANRMSRSGATVRDLEARGVDFGRLALGGQLTDDYRLYEAAALEWVDAQLRLTTGAQAPPAEIRAAFVTYYPQPGDSRAVRQQKAQMREAAERDAIARGQGGASSPDRQQSVAPQPSQNGQSRRRERGPPPTDAQLATSNRILESRPGGRGRNYPAGDRYNPIRINPNDPTGSFGNVRSGEYFITPDGQVRGPKP